MATRLPRWITSKERRMTAEPSYETAFQALQEVIEKLETSELPLEEALSLYEKGKMLSAQCLAILEKAQLRVSQLNPAAPAEDED